jgi:hypothetical protein
MLIITHVYELPFAAGRQFINHGVMSYIVGGWDPSGLWTVYMGMHYNPFDAVANISGSQYPGSSNFERPNVVAGCDPNVVPGGKSRLEYFNPSCFTLPQAYTFGNSGAYTIQGPGLFTVDFGLHRNFAIKESMRLQVRWETFNTTNHPNFQFRARYTRPSERLSRGKRQCGRSSWPVLAKGDASGYEVELLSVLAIVR